MIVIMLLCVPLLLVVFIGIKARSLIFTIAGEPGIKAYIPIVNCATYGKITNATACGAIEGVCAIASKVLLAYAMILIMREAFTALIMLTISLATATDFGYVFPNEQLINILFILGISLIVLQFLCRGIVRYRFNKAYGIHPAMLMLWIFLPHIAEIMVSGRIGNADTEERSR